MRAALLVVLSLAGCSKKETRDDCDRFFTRSRPILDAMMKDSGKHLTDADAVKFVADCREHRGKPENKDDALMNCVLETTDDDKIKACWSAAFGDYNKKSKQVEAAVQLDRLGKNLKVYYVTNDTFPVGKSGPTPAKGCCEQPGARCAVTDAWTKDKVWQALEFQIDEPNLFQYSYESDGKRATVMAVGDLDCDSTMITYKLEAGVDNGVPGIRLTEPPPNSD